MKKYLSTIVLIVAFTAIFTPFASNNPDGLEKVADTLGIEENEPLWRGLMSDYSLENIENPYVSTLLAGVSGILVVFLASLLLGKAIVLRKR